VTTLRRAQRDDEGGGTAEGRQLALMPTATGDGPDWGRARQPACEGKAVEHSQPAAGRQAAGGADGAGRGRLPGVRAWAIFLVAAAWVSSPPAIAAGSMDAAARSTLARALDAADSGQWPVARRHIDSLGSPLLRTYIVWREFVAGSSAVDFDRYNAFLRRYPDWPRLGAMRANAELRIDESVGYAERLEFFTDRRPATRQGRIRLAEATLAMGDVDQGRALVRQSWINDNFGQSEEQFFLQQFGHLLGAEEHQARLDRLLWDGREGEVRRMLRRVDPGHAALAEARLALQAMAPGVDGLIRRVPRSLENEPGLLYDRLRWRRLRGRDDGGREILLDPPAELARPSLWWNERAYQIRSALSERDFDTAYALARGHGQHEGTPFAEAAWLVGWLALRHADDPRTALGHFAQMYDAVATPISRSRAAYWGGRAAAAMGDARATGRWYRLAADHPTTYYGQLALAELSEPLQLIGIAAGLNGVHGPDPAFDGNDQVRLVRLFCALEMADRAVPFLERLLLDVPDKSRVVALAHDCRRPDIMVELGKHGVSAGVIDPLVAFPIPAQHGLLHPVAATIEPALSMAIARQESHFAAAAQSPAGALGLMQVMPATGRAVAQRFGLNWSERLLHHDPEYNAKIGVHYLGMLAERYGGELAMMAAAYNAGPPRVSAWVALHGDPRRLDPHGIVDWIELIPFRETRNYVQRVIEGRNVYRELIGSAAIRPVSIAGDTSPLVPPPIPAPKPRIW
jgi:soluble lytic murein transglycosylase